ncbi:MAG: hypothetical protein ACE5H7_16255, partial [Acidiferrobacterales bacterium]
RPPTSNLPGCYRERGDVASLSKHGKGPLSAFLNTLPGGLVNGVAGVSGRHLPASASGRQADPREQTSEGARLAMRQTYDQSVFGSQHPAR